MKTKITRTAPRISDKSADLYKSIFGNVNAGMEYIGDAFPALYRLTLDHLRREFARGELMLMIDVCNGLWLTPGHAGQHLDIQVADGIRLDQLDEKWEIDAGALNNKIAELTVFEAACLELWVQAFWRQEEHDNIEEYVASMAGKK